MTEPLTLVQASGKPRQGFLVLLPVYRPGEPVQRPDERERATFGWVYAPLVIDEILGSLEGVDAALSLSLWDAAAPPGAAPFFDGPAAPAAGGALAWEAVRPVLGRSWRIVARAGPGFAADVPQTRPAAVGLGVAGVLAALAAVAHAMGLRRREGQAVAEQQARYATLVERSADAIVGESPDGVVTAWNAAAERIFGWSRDEALGRPLMALLVPPQRADEERRVLDTVSRGQSMPPFETVRLRRDGSEVAVSVAASPLLDAQGRTVEIAKTIRDISGLRAAEAALRDLNATLEQQVAERSAALDAALRENIALLSTIQTHALYSVADRDGVIIDVNDNFCRISGYRRDELIGHNHRIVGSGLHPPAFFAAMWHTISSGRPWRGEICNRAKGGPLYWVDSIIAPFRGVDGRIERYISIRTDITSRKLAQQHVADSEVLLDTTGRVAGVGGWRLDLASSRLTWTAETKRLHEVPPDYEPDLHGAIEFYTPPSRPLIGAAVQRAITEGTGWDLELELVTARGRRFWARAQGQAELRDGRVVALMGAFQDITRQRAAEDALRRATAAAEAANAAKSDFLANTSHEIRTPLNALVGLAHLLARTSLDDDQRDLVTKIRSAGSTLGALIDDVLDLSKIEAGEMRIEQAPFAVRPLVSDLARVMAVQAASRHLAFEVHVADDVPAAVNGDALRLRQILANLLGNALKFTERGQVMLDVRCEAVGPAADSARRNPAPGGHDAGRHQEDAGNEGCDGEAESAVVLRFEVHDTGIGISAEAQAHLFKPFSQADASTTRRFGGTGLGLSIVSRLTALMGGDVDLRSLPGQGSVFIVTLPFVRAASPVSDASAGTAPDADGGLRLPGTRLMVVDDSDINLEVARRILALEGAQVVCCSSGAQALQRLQAPDRPFDAVLMDVQMPTMDGLETIRRLRADPALAGLPVIAVTAGTLLAERQRALDAGMDDCVTKPIDPPALVRLVRHHVERRRGAPLTAMPARQRPEDPTRADEPAAGLAAGPGDAGWPVIAGIDAAAWLEQLGGDSTLFLRLLGRLLDEFGDLASAETGAAAAGLASPRDVAARMHKLRGAAALLGARALQAAAHAAEQAAGQAGEPEHAAQTAAEPGAGASDDHLRMRERCAEAGRLLAGLRRAAGPWLTAGAAPGVFRAPPGAMLHGMAARDAAAATGSSPTVAALRRQLAQRDLAALGTVRALAPALRDALGDDGARTLADAVDGLDFDKAIELLSVPERA